MAFPNMKFGLFENLKDLVTKGPQGMVNERMKEHLAHADELNKLDRTDPEAMKKYMAQQNAGVMDMLESKFGSGIVSAENQAHMQALQNKAIEDSAVMHRMLAAQKAKEAEEAKK